MAFEFETDRDLMRDICWVHAMAMDGELRGTHGRQGEDNGLAMDGGRGECGQGKYATERNNGRDNGAGNNGAREISLSWLKPKSDGGVAFKFHLRFRKRERLYRYHYKL